MFLKTSSIVGGNEMNKKNGFVAILVSVLMFTSMFFLVQGDNHPTNATDEIIPESISLPDDQKVAAIVNGVEIPQKEYERLLVNAEILYRAQLSQFLEQKNPERLAQGNMKFESRP